MSNWPLLSELYCNTLKGAPSELASHDEYDNALPRIQAWREDLLGGEAPNTIVKVFILGKGVLGKRKSAVVYWA